MSLVWSANLFPNQKNRPVTYDSVLICFHVRIHQCLGLNMHDCLHSVGLKKIIADTIRYLDRIGKRQATKNLIEKYL